MANNTLTTYNTGDSAWFNNELIGLKRLHKKELKKGFKDPGYVLPLLTLELFLEGVFTMKPVPNELFIDTPDGEFHLTAFTDKENRNIWLIRRPTGGGLYDIVNVDVKDMFEFAIREYPDGIGSEGYNLLALSLLGGKRERIQEIYEKSFYEKNHGCL